MMRQPALQRHCNSGANHQHLMLVAILVTTSLFVLLPGRTTAQGGDSGDTDKQIYELERERIEGLPLSDKPSAPLPPPEADELQKSFKYTPMDVDFSPELSAPVINAVPVPKPRWDRLYPVHIKAGFGNYLTPAIDATVSNAFGGRDPRLSWQANYHHLSTWRGHVEDANFAENHAGVKGRYYLDKHTAYGHLNYRHDKLNFFGDTSSINLEDRPDSTRQRFSRIEALVGFKNNFDTTGFQYDVGLRVRQFSDRHENSEFHFSLLPKAKYHINDMFAAGVDLRLTTSSINEQLVLGDAVSRLFVDGAPFVTVQWQDLRVKAGVRFAYVSQDSVSETRVFPILDAQYALMDGKLAPFLKLGGQTHYTQRFGVVDRNPWLDPQLSVVAPTYENFNLEAGVRGHIANVNYRVAGFFRSFDNYLIFEAPHIDGPELPEIATPRQGYFLTNYRDDFTMAGLDLEVEAMIRDKGNVGAMLNYTGGSVADSGVYHIPQFMSAIWGGYQFGDKVNVRSQLNLIGPRDLGVDTTGAIVEDELFIDLNLSAEYHISSRISVWLQLNNLLNQEYFRWYGYQERQIDFRLGGSVKF
ncbi:MAG: hypothetical protein ACOCZ8_00255 [Bacteroidota bacterium]